MILVEGGLENQQPTLTNACYTIIQFIILHFPDEQVAYLIGVSKERVVRRWSRRLYMNQRWEWRIIYALEDYLTDRTHDPIPF